MTYKEKLLDPRWQKKRLEVLQRENFKCQWCLCSYKTLHIHHWDYVKGREPWEYESDELGCLCTVCHAFNHYKGKDYLLIKSVYMDLRNAIICIIQQSSNNTDALLNLRMVQNYLFTHMKKGI